MSNNCVKLHCRDFFLETKLYVPRVKLEALVKCHALGHDDSAGTGSWATVGATVVWDNIVLDKTRGDAAIDAVAEKAVWTSTHVSGNGTLAGSLEELGLERSRVLAKAGRIFSH